MLFAAVHESAYGTKRTPPSALHMSAFDPKRTRRLILMRGQNRASAAPNVADMPVAM